MLGIPGTVGVRWDDAGTDDSGHTEQPQKLIGSGERLRSFVFESQTHNQDGVLKSKRLKRTELFRFAMK